MAGADCFFRMGSTHQVCQDYATAGDANGLAYAALSDGCSSSPDTDFGARFMVRAFLENLAPHPDPGRIAKTAARMAGGTGLPQSCLDATLLMAVADQEFVRIHRSGDGVVAWRLRNGTWQYEAVEFENNAPRYLSYMLNPAYSERHRQMVSHRILTRGSRLKDDEGWDSTSDQVGINPFRDVDLWCIDRADCDLVLLFSDGAESFLDANSASVPLTAVLDHVLAFKGLSGQFIARRCGRFLNKACAELGWTHVDDFSVAGIYLGDAP